MIGQLKRHEQNYNSYRRWNWLRDFPKHKSIQPLSNSFIGIRQDMTVAIHGSLNWGVAELGLDEFDVLALGDEKWGVGVA